MTTFVGTQAHFEKALESLIELDYDAVEAYDAAIDRLENDKYRKKMIEFKDDHLRHIEELNYVLSAHSYNTIDGPCAKQWLTKGKVVLANLLGDNSILAAMLSNEDDTKTAYEKINNHSGKWEDATEPLKRGLADEKRHWTWLKENKE